MPSWLRFPLTLAVIAGLAGGGLAFVEAFTKQRIEENKKRKLNAAFEEVPGYRENRELPVGEKDKKEGAKCFRLLGEGGKPIACAAEVRCTDPPGYNTGDPIVLVVVLDSGLKNILLVRSTSNKETPGLGTRVSAEEPRNSLYGKLTGREPRRGPKVYKFLDRFKNRPVGKLKFGEDKLDAISGATVSSKAVLGGVRKAAAVLERVTGRK